MNLHSFLYYCCYSPKLIFACIFWSVYVIHDFSATRQHVEDMKKTFIHEMAWAFSRLVFRNRGFSLVLASLRCLFYLGTAVI